MAGNKCNKCSGPFSEKDTVITCDCCAILLHEICIYLFIYSCPECRGSSKQIPRLLSGLDEALKDNAILQEENRKLHQELAKIRKSHADCGADACRIINEIQERQNRACNLIIRTVQESGNVILHVVFLR